MASSIFSFSSFLPFKFTGSNRECCRAHRAGASSNSMATRATLESGVSYERRCANYPVSSWDDAYIQSLNIDYVESDGNSHARIMEEVRHLLGKQTEPVDQLRLVDALQQLGVAYNFEREIRDVLTTIHRSADRTVMMMKDNLYAMSLLFRLLREHGFDISPVVFDSFKEEKGGFKSSLGNEIRGMLSLYEASFLAMDGDNQMDEAREFADSSLRAFNETLLIRSLPVEHVTHALDLPLHWRIQRQHTRWFIDQYEREEDMNPTLLRFAKLDFNLTQRIYMIELKQLSSWWTELGLAQKLQFARSRLVENHFWSVGWAPHPKFWRTRESTTKFNCLITAIDDVYDVYGSLEELELFTDVICRWDTNAAEELPDYMKACFMALHNTINDIADKTMKLKCVDVQPHLRRAWEDICKAYLLEAKWYHKSYMPTMKEYMDNAWISISGHIASTTAFCTSEDLTMEALARFNFYPDVVRHSSMLLRLCNDMATSSAELERGDVPKSIQCYMLETGVTEAAARKHIKVMIAATWKKLNDDRIANSNLEESLKSTAINIPRTSQFFYQNRDRYGESDREVKAEVASLLTQPIPL